MIVDRESLPDTSVPPNERAKEERQKRKKGGKKKEKEKGEKNKSGLDLPMLTCFFRFLFCFSAVSSSATLQQFGKESSKSGHPSIKQLDRQRTISNKLSDAGTVLNRDCVISTVGALRKLSVIQICDIILSWSGWCDS